MYLLKQKLSFLLMEGAYAARCVPLPALSQSAPQRALCGGRAVALGWGMTPLVSPGLGGLWGLSGLCSLGPGGWGRALAVLRGQWVR